MKQPGAIIVLLLFVAAVSFTLASEQYGGRKLKAALAGAAEVPGPGDSDGAGQFTATFNARKGQVCYELNVSSIGNPTASEIGAGTTSAAGSVVINLGAPTGGVVRDCVALDKEKIEEIIRNPENFYVNVHNVEFPEGAIRGQLTR